MNMNQVNVSGGPVSYNYPVHRVSLHFGMDGRSGSEHTVAGSSFVGEVRKEGGRGVEIKVQLYSDYFSKRVVALRWWPYFSFYSVL